MSTCPQVVELSLFHPRVVFRAPPPPVCLHLPHSPLKLLTFTEDTTADSPNTGSDVSLQGGATGAHREDGVVLAASMGRLEGAASFLQLTAWSAAVEPSGSRFSSLMQD